MFGDYYHLHKYMIDYNDILIIVNFDKKTPMALLKNKVIKELRKRNYGAVTAAELNFIVQKAKKHGKLIFKKFRYGGSCIL